MKKIKRKYYLLIVVLSCTYFLSAQGNYNSALSGSIGYAQDGIGFDMSYNFNLNRYEFIQTSLMATFADKKYKSYLIPADIYTANVGYFSNIFGSRRNFLKSSLGGGALFGYEDINSKNKILENGALLLSESKFIYGFFVAFETDFYISDYYSFILKFQESYHVNSDAGKFMPYVSVGLRYFIY